MVITLGCIPTLGPLTKLRMTKLRYYISNPFYQSRTHKSMPESLTLRDQNFSTQISSQKHPRHYHELDASLASLNSDGIAGNISADRDYPISPAKMNIHRNDSFSLSYEKRPSPRGEV